MWKYVKSLEYPVNIKKKDLRMAKYLVTQYGGSYINRDFRKDEVMNNYCINLKKRNNKPYCKLINKEIQLSTCRECNNKEYKKISADLCRKTQCSAEIKRKKSTFGKKSPATSGQQKSNNNQMRKYSQTLAKEQQKKIKMHNKSKKLAKLEKNRKSVFTDDLDYCYLCGKKKNDLHEVFGGRNRINSIKFNFILPLCRECHSSNQNNAIFNDYWHKQGQLYWEKNIGSREEFIKVFKRNYLE